MKRLSLLLILVIGLFMVLGCEDDSGTDPNENNMDPWIGTWLSADANVAPILVALFSLDSVEATFNEDNTILLRQHVIDGAWVEVPGTYTVTESADSDIHSIQLVYATFSQEGIIEIDGTTLSLEAVQTLPNIGATVPTPAAGFGADPTLGTSNIQTYILQD